MDPRSSNFSLERITSWGEKPEGGISPPDPVGAYDSLRHRICFMAGGRNPSTVLWYYDIQENRWVNPQPKDRPDPKITVFTAGSTALQYDSFNDVLVLIKNFKTNGDQNLEL